MVWWTRWMCHIMPSCIQGDQLAAPPQTPPQCMVQKLKSCDSPVYRFVSQLVIEIALFHLLNNMMKKGIPQTRRSIEHTLRLVYINDVLPYLFHNTFQQIYISISKEQAQSSHSLHVEVIWHLLPALSLRNNALLLRNNSGDTSS